VPHIVGKLSTRATILLYTSLQSKIYIRSYGPPKCQKDVTLMVNNKKYYKG
jgi:hypothetical protein